MSVTGGNFNNGSKPKGEGDGWDGTYTITSTTGNVDIRVFAMKSGTGEQTQHTIFGATKDTPNNTSVTYRCQIKYRRDGEAWDEDVTRTRTVSSSDWNNDYNAYVSNAWWLGGTENLYYFNSINTPIYKEEDVAKIKHYIATGDISQAENYAELIQPNVHVSISVTKEDAPTIYLDTRSEEIPDNVNVTLSLRNSKNNTQQDLEIGKVTTVNYTTMGGGKLVGTTLYFTLHEDVSHEEDGELVVDNYVYTCSAFIYKNGTSTHLVVANDGKLHLSLEIVDSGSVPPKDKVTDDTTNNDTDNSNVTPNYNNYAPVSTLTKTYKLDSTRLQTLGRKLWNDTMFDDWNLLNESPMDNIVSCVAMPINMQGTTAQVVIGNIEMDGLSGEVVQNPVYKNTFTREVMVEPRYYNWLDYEDTTIQLHLPYIGFKSLDTKQVMGNYIKVEYVFDCVTGMCEAIVWCKLNGAWTMIHRFGGIAGIQIPLNSRNNADWISSIGGNLLGSVVSLGVGVATGGVGAVLGVANAMGSVMNASKEKRTTDSVGTPSPMCSSAIDNSIYLIYERPKAIIPKMYAHNVGWNSYFNSAIRDIRGYAQMIHVDLSQINCMEEEREEIKSILESGFYYYP